MYTIQNENQQTQASSLVYFEELEGALYIIYLPIEILRNIRMRYALWVRFFIIIHCHNRFT